MSVESFRRMKSSQIYLPMALAAAVVVGMFIGSRYDYPARPATMHSEEVKEQKIRQIINYIDYDYVDDVNTDSLLDLTIRDMLRRLDPHSSYIAQQNVQASEESIQGHFDGVGIEFQMHKDSLNIVRVVKDGPAYEAGLRGGDRIVAIDGESIVGDYEETGPIIETLRGQSGTQVEVRLARRGSNETRTANITRGPIPIYSVDVSYMVNDSVGLIKINRFSETTTDEFRDAIVALKRKGMTHMILDLRDNPGGLLRIAEEVCDEFLPKGTRIVYTQDREGNKDQSYATNRGSFKEGEVVVLINENSASAAEIVAGALQDNDRATIIGRRSFGKGLVQEEMMLSDGSRMRLTTARYYTPTGRSIQRSYEDGYESYQRDYYKRMESGELFRPDSSQFELRDRYITPGGKAVYGGGGIMPDIFVPVDSLVYTNEWLYYHFGTQAISGFAFTWADRHRGELEELSVEGFISDWQVSEDLYLEAVTAMGAERYESRIDSEMRDFINRRLKALIGKNIWGWNGYYPVAFENDPAVLASLIHWSK